MKTPKEFVERAIRDVGFGRRRVFKAILEDYLHKLGPEEELLAIIVNSPKPTTHLMITNKRVIRVNIHGYHREESYLKLSDVKNINFNRKVMHTDIGILGPNIEFLEIKNVLFDIADEFRRLLESLIS